MCAYNLASSYHLIFFSPSEVSVKTNTKDNSLTIDAEHKSDDAKYEFHRYYVLPQGVKAD
uniref:SHSP domain-containing protein n=1 Tax=Plectus sambesii TaxID=2011161 RepID=A0A914VBK3_9BILA